MLGILFSAPMVRAINNNNKSQTRRLRGLDKINENPNNWTLQILSTDESDGLTALFENTKTGEYKKIICPYGVPGNYLYVKETWRIGAWDENNGSIAVDYRADGFARQEWLRVDDPECFKKYWIQSTDDALNAGLEPDSDGNYCWDPGQGPTRWRPSIFMPRYVARTHLRIKDIRVERLHDVTDDDAKAEGISSYWAEPHRDVAPFIGAAKEFGADLCFTRREAFQQLWDSINAKTGCGWVKNPWLWVVEFKKVDKPCL